MFNNCLHGYYFLCRLYCIYLQSNGQWDHINYREALFINKAITIQNQKSQYKRPKYQGSVAGTGLLTIQPV